MYKFILQQNLFWNTVNLQITDFVYLLSLDTLTGPLNKTTVQFLWNIFNLSIMKFYVRSRAFGNNIQLSHLETNPSLSNRAKLYPELKQVLTRGDLCTSQV